MNEFVLGISRIDKRDIDNVGKYAGELGDLSHIGIPIPEGFVITLNCLRQFLIDNNLSSSSTGKEILHAFLSEEMLREISKAWGKLESVFKDAAVIVTASSPFSSLNSACYEVKGDANLILKIKEIWSLQRNIAIAVQRKIESGKVGTLFTQYPHTTDKTVIHIKHKSMISHYSIAKNSLDITFKGHLTSAKRPNKISDQEAIDLAEIGKKIEKYFYFPQEVEFAIDKNKIYILETKPMTNIAVKPFSYNVAARMRRSPKIGRDVLLKGISIFPGIVTGPVKVLSNSKDFGNVIPGQIIVAPQLVADSFPKIKKAGALITEGVTFAGADKILYRRQVARPSICNAKNATRILHTGNVVTVDGERGEIYKGGFN